MTIKPEQVPEASMRALCKSMNCEWVMQSPEDLAVCRRHIAAAINAWPRAEYGSDDGGETYSVVLLPLTGEP